MAKVRDLMQREVATLRASDHLDLASDIMQLGRIRHLPVEDDGKVVGVVSQRDLFRAAISSVLQFRPTAEREWLAKIAVTEIMASPVRSVTPETPVREAAALMADLRIGCLPVVEGEQLVGLLSESDILRYIARGADEPDH